MDGEWKRNFSETQRSDVALSDYSSEELLGELARRLREASKELKLLRDTPPTSERGSNRSSERQLPETAEGLMAIIDVGPRLEEGSTGWDNQDPYATAKLIRKKAIVKLPECGLVWLWIPQDSEMARSIAVDWNARRV